MNGKLRITNYELRIKRKNIPCLNEINQRHTVIFKKRKQKLIVSKHGMSINYYELRILNLQFKICNLKSKI